MAQPVVTVNVTELMRFSEKVKKNMENFNETKKHMDSELEAFLWKDNTAEQFKKDYKDGLKPIESKLLPAMEKCQKFLNNLAGIVKEKYVENKNLSNHSSAKDTSPSSTKEETSKKENDIKVTIPVTAATLTALIAGGVALKKGDKNESVKFLQEQLKALGYKDKDGKDLIDDSDFGGKTEYALKRFQRNSNLEETGIADEKVWTLLNTPVDKAKISDYISYKEATVTTTGLDNTPNANQLEAMKALNENVFHPARTDKDCFGEPIIITSFFRSEAVNTAVGGEKNSDHLTGQAMDIVSGSNKKTTEQLFSCIHDNKDKRPFKQLILEKKETWNEKEAKVIESTWVHVAYDNKNSKNNKKEVLTITQSLVMKDGKPVMKEDGKTPKIEKKTELYVPKNQPSNTAQNPTT